MNDSQDVVWSFGYGSNMDVKSLQTKKHVNIVDHVCAVLRGWKMSFTLPGPAKVEPAYANVIKGAPGDEVHGVAFCMTRASGEELDRTESGYNKEMVTLHAYDGRVLEGFTYVNKPGALSEVELAPSARYLGVLVRGARAGGCNEEYIQRLSQHKVRRPASGKMLTLHTSVRFVAGRL
jgi:cation transport regulator ChaC